MAEGRKCTSGKDSLGRGVAAYAASGISAYESELSTHLILRLRTYSNIAKIPVAMRLGGTPVLIPNTKVKT